MREIKFRAWNKIEETLKPIQDYLIFFDNGQMLPTQDYYIIEQYTGLKDKNGKEIYEGDIIVYANLEPSLKIEFKNGGFGYRYLGNFYNLTAFKCSFTEIIGNIHESK